MQIVHIFGSKVGPQEGEGLWATKYEPGIGHAFREFFDRMADAEWVYNFCLENMADLEAKFGYSIGAEDAADELMQEALELKAKIVSLAEGIPGKTLQDVFSPLYPSESDLVELQLSKGSVKSKSNKYNPKLRIYGVRYSDMTYVVTGGAIKLTNTMEERPHTDEEFKKMKKVKTWLNEEGAYFPEDLISLP